MADKPLYWPRFPALLMNEHFIILWRSDCTWLNVNLLRTTYMVPCMMAEKAFWNGRFRRRAVLIDIDCKRFPVIGAVNKGVTRNPLHFSCKHRIVRVGYVFGEPTQLTYDEARSEIVELVCRRRWHHQARRSEKQFRAFCAGFADMREFLLGKRPTKDDPFRGPAVSFYGRWLF